VIVIVGAEVVFIVELAGVAFVAYRAVEEAYSGGEGVVSLEVWLLYRDRTMLGHDILEAL
jgi:hypothetical protein